MKKRVFSESERFAVWQYHGQKCWRCKKPLEHFDFTIDHIIPESYLTQDREKMRTFADFELDEGFNIDGFENWLPCCFPCNRKKSNEPPIVCEANRHLLHKMFGKAADIKRVWESIEKSATRGKIFGKLAIAFEKKDITAKDLIESLRKIGVEIAPPETGEMIQLEKGHWIRKDDIAKIAPCTCERNFCVGCQEKITECIFTRYDSEWVRTTGLFWRCYDEVIKCPRCRRKHKRGHIGSNRTCGKPYADQVNQTDLIANAVSKRPE